MASFVVMTPPEGSAAEPVLVRDGFTIFGFLVPPLWLLWHGLWIEAALAFGLLLGIPVTAAWLGFGETATWLSLLVSLFVGLEGETLRLASLRRRGWTDDMVVDAADLEEAEIRFAAESMPRTSAA